MGRGKGSKVEKMPVIRKVITQDKVIKHRGHERINQGIVRQLMAERLGTTQKGGTPLHDFMEDNYDELIKEYHAGPD